MTFTEHDCPGYSCLFCGGHITPGKLDPCAIVLVARISCPRSEQKEQTFYCHFSCLEACSIQKGAFYIAEKDFPTVGEFQ